MILKSNIISWNIYINLSVCSYYFPFVSINEHHLIKIWGWTIGQLKSQTRLLTFNSTEHTTQLCLNYFES